MAFVITLPYQSYRILKTKMSKTLTKLVEESRNIYQTDNLPYPNMEILDTTLRDGEQTEGVAFSPQEKLTLAKKLLQLGIHRLEVASAGVTQEEQAAVKAICSYAKTQNLLESIEVLAFVNQASIDWAYQAGCRTVNLLCKGSLNHLQNQLKKTKEQHLEEINNIIRYAKTQGISTNIYLEDWSNGMLNSKDYVYHLIENIENAKRIMLPDTLGILSPEQTYRFIKEIKQRFNKHFDFHAHNDYGLATANTIQAVLAGIDAIHLTINNMGERAGNASLIETAVVLKDLYSIDLNLDESQFQEISELVARFSGKKPAHNTPIVGSSFGFQTAGIHADGDKKAGLYKTKLRPERFGKRTTRYALGKMAGKSTIELNLKELGIELTPEQIKKLTKEISELGGKKEQITQPDLLFLIADLFEQPEIIPFKILECEIKKQLNNQRSAYVKISYKGEILEAEAKGDGGYDAAINAIKQSLKEKQISLPDLVDYTITIPPGGETSALTMASIEWQHKNKTQTSKGVETDQDFAALKATEKILNFILRD